jgi:hypothetical protein
MWERAGDAVATKLMKPLVRDTGVSIGGKPVLTFLLPSQDGGTLVFKQKGARGTGISVALKKVAEWAAGETELIRTPVLKREDCSENEMLQKLVDADTVNLADFEARVMVECNADITPHVAGRIQAIAREIREERRLERGLHKVLRGVL